jgi:hypothetical protein
MKKVGYYWVSRDIKGYYLYQRPVIPLSWISAGELNIDLRPANAKIFTCETIQSMDKPNLKSYVPSRHIGKEMVARAFLRAQQISRLMSWPADRAVIYYTWGYDDENRASFDPNYENNLTAPVRKLSNGLGFESISEYSSEAHKMFSDRFHGGIWASNFVQFERDAKAKWNTWFYSYRGIKTGANDAAWDKMQSRGLVIAEKLVAQARVYVNRDGGQRQDDVEKVLYLGEEIKDARRTIATGGKAIAKKVKDVKKALKRAVYGAVARMVMTVKHIKITDANRAQYAALLDTTKQEQGSGVVAADMTVAKRLPAGLPVVASVDTANGMFVSFEDMSSFRIKIASETVSAIIYANATPMRSGSVWLMRRSS